MNMDDLDWLDSRLATETYLPDDGFTSRVVGSLPQRPRFSLPLRTFILCAAGFVASCLLLWQLPPVLQSALGYLGGYSIGIHLGRLSMDLQQPMVLILLGALAAGCGFAVMSIARRWA